MRQAFYVVLVLLMVSIGVNVWQAMREPMDEMVVVTDTVWMDSIIREPVAVESVRTGRVIVVRVPVPTAKPSDTLRDSVEVVLPVEQRRYEDSLYTAWVSGYEPRLDSIRLRMPTVTVMKTKTITKAARFSVGVQTGAGVGLFTRQPDVYVGLGVSWNLWSR